MSIAPVGYDQAAGQPAGESSIDRVKLRDGSEVRIDSVKGQEDALLAFMQALSSRSRQARFGSAASNLELAARWAARADGTKHLGAVAVDASDRIVAHAACVRLPDARAEVAVAVDETHRRLGLATILLTHLAREAEQQGIRYLTAEVLPYNFEMLSIFRHRFNASAHQVQDAILIGFPSSAWRLATLAHERSRINNLTGSSLQTAWRTVRSLKRTVVTLVGYHPFRRATEEWHE